MTQDTAINQPPKVLLWFKIYCGFVCLLYLATAAFSLFFFFADPSDTEMSQTAARVTGVPDEKKGERLVVLHKLAEAKWTELAAKLPQLALPNLWKPRADQFHHVDALPMLGTGKLDLRKIRELAVLFSTATTERMNTRQLSE